MFGVGVGADLGARRTVTAFSALPPRPIAPSPGGIPSEVTDEVLAWGEDLRAQAADQFEVVELEGALPGARVVGGLSAQGLTVRRCTFEGEGVAVSNTFGGTALVEDCKLSLSIGGIGVDIGHVTARNLTFDVAEQNVRVAGAGASIELYECELRGGTLWTIDAGGDILARNCTISNVGGLTVRGSIRTTLDIDLRSTSGERPTSS